MTKQNAFVVIAVLMVTCYLTANVMAVRIIQIGTISIFDAGTIVFPLTYMLGEVVTEIWGFHRARKLICLTFACQLMFVLFTWVGLHLPYPPETSEMVNAYHMVFSYVPRIMMASLSAFLVGELTNAYIMSSIKRHFGGPLWVRTIGSSIVGYAIDTTLFVLIAYYGTVSTAQLWTMIGIQIAVKVLIEVCASTPMAYALVTFIRHKLH